MNTPSVISGGQAEWDDFKILGQLICLWVNISHLDHTACNNVIQGCVNSPYAMITQPIICNLQKKPDWVLGAEKDGEKAMADKTADDDDETAATAASAAAADVAAAAPDASADASADANTNGDNQAEPAAEVPEAEPQVWFLPPRYRVPPLFG